MRKMLLLLAALMIFTAVFTGCSSDSQSKVTHEQEQIQRDKTVSDVNIMPNEEKNSKINSEQKAKEQGTNETKTDSGRYQGQADSNFIEIKISGVPDEKATKVFMLSDDLKEKFDQLKLKKNDEIKFSYFQNKNEQLVIVEIVKM